MIRELNTILLVDDEPDILTIARIALVDVGGLTVHTYANGRDALDHVQEIMPDLVILDMMMPRQNGLDLMRALRDVPGMSDIPVIFMTAKVQREEVNSYLKAGAAGVIQKPFDPMSLASQVRKLWNSVQGDSLG